MISETNNPDELLAKASDQKKPSSQVLNIRLSRDSFEVINQQPVALNAPSLNAIIEQAVGVFQGRPERRQDSQDSEYPSS